MKANEFVKEHGFQYTRNLVRDYPNHTHVTNDGRMFINENTCASHIKVQLNGLVKMDDLRTELAKREPMDLRSVDIPHGTIVLEKWNDPTTN